MKNICFYLQVHQPYRLKRYRFFDIGVDHFYFDDARNRMVMQQMARDYYMPLGEMIKKIINEHGERLKFSISISGTAIEQMKLYTPQVVDMVADLVDSGNVELLGETYAHSLSSFVKDGVEFERQVEQHRRLVVDTFGYEPSVFRNTDFLYSDKMAIMTQKAGYGVMVVDGVDKLLNGKSPNFIYRSSVDDLCMNLMLRNKYLSDELKRLFLSNTLNNLNVEDVIIQYVNNIKLQGGDVINIFMDNQIFAHSEDNGQKVVNTMELLINKIIEDPELNFVTPSDIVKSCNAVDALSCLSPVARDESMCDEAVWMGNELQRDAFDRLYNLQQIVYRLDVSDLMHVWLALQNSDHFDYMSSRWFKKIDRNTEEYNFDTPYDAYINYMNVLSDFSMTLNSWMDKRFI